MTTQFCYWKKSLGPLPLWAPAALLISIHKAPWVDVNHTPIPPSSLAQSLCGRGACMHEVLEWLLGSFVKKSPLGCCLPLLTSSWFSTSTNSLYSPDSMSHGQSLPISYPSLRCVLQTLKARQVHLRFRQMEENLWSHGNAWHAFIQGWRDPRGCKPCASQEEVPTPLYTKCTKSWRGAKILYNKAWFCACGSIQGYGISAYWASLKAMGMLLILVAQTSW